ncbi:carbohydrate kinase [Histomonas meleagridis]|uniref:carbohydrate kinase n=1 Tax=Histomonas meleagridis TaxID=135588 RepID=UPI00355A73CF|nr:carbohydrate kinase [Histomonas meleagridis]KAH0798180.1 carbohydrate kinase [Histomonas meleagridis]
MKQNCDILFIGHCTRDEITIKSKLDKLPGGGVYFGAISAGWCLKRFSPTEAKELRVLTIGDPEDFIVIKKEFEESGIKLSLIENDCTTTFVHSFKDEQPDKRISSVRDVARSFEWKDIADYHARIFYVNPLFYGEVDPSLFELMKNNCDLISVDSQGLLRRRNGNELYHQTPENLESVLKYVDILKVDAEEASSLSGITDNTDAACGYLLTKGPKYIICTQSTGVAIYHGDEKYWSDFGKWTLEGRTGRGDTVSAAFILLHFILGFDIQNALNKAAEGCSNKMMHPGAAVEADFAQIQ